MKKFGKILLYSAIALVIFIALTTGANILFFWSILGSIEKFVRVATGLDPNFAKGIAALVISLLLLLPLRDMFKSFTLLPQKEKGKYRSVTFAIISIFFMLIYLGGGEGNDENFFNPYTGKAMKYYYVSPNGEFKFSPTPGFDPETGEELKPVTKEIIRQYKGLGSSSNQRGYSGHSQPYHQPVQRYSPPPPEPDPVPEVRDNPDPPERTQADEPRNTSGKSWGLIERGETATVTFMNWYKEPITVYNLANEETCVLPAVSTRFHKLHPGRYRYYRNGEMLGSFEVLKGIDREMVFGQREKEIVPPRIEPAQIASEEQKGTLICENKTSDLLRVCDHSQLIVLTVPAYQSKKTELPPGRYSVYFGKQKASLEVKANRTQTYEYVSGTKEFVVHRRR